MSDLTVGAVVQVNLSRFVFLYSNTATKKHTYIKTKNGSITQYRHRNFTVKTTDVTTS